MSEYQTSQKRMVLDYLKANSGKIISVQEIYQAIQGEQVSLSSVYRILSQLKKEERVFQLPNKRNGRIVNCYIYEEDVNNNRVRMICNECKKCFYVHVDTLRVIRQRLGRVEKFIPQDGEYTIYGICADCKTTKNDCCK